MNDNLRGLLYFLSGAGMLGVWLYLIMTGKTSPDALVTVLQVALGGMAAHLINQGAQSANPTQPKETQP